MPERGVAGLAVAAAVVGSTVSGLLSGPVIDRIGARRAWITSTLAGSAIGALTCLLWFAGGLSAAWFIALCAVRAAWAGADEPFTPDWHVRPEVTDAVVGGLTGVLGSAERAVPLARALGYPAAG